MKRLSKIKRLAAIALMIVGVAMQALCATPDGDSAPDEMELSVDENIATPKVPKKAQTMVRATIDGLRRSLIKQGLNVASMRNAEVLQVTVPCSSLFAPNAKALKASAEKILSPIVTVAKQPELYKILIAVHADNTGDDTYADELTEARANAIDDYLWEKAGQIETFVVPYGLGHDEPLTNNDSALNRHKNRRVEIFIVPREELFKR